MSFCIFLYVILGWYHNNLGWKYCLLFYLRKKKLFWTNKKLVYLIFINKISWYHPKIAYENIVQKDMNKFHNPPKNTKLYSQWAQKDSKVSYISRDIFLNFSFKWRLCSYFLRQYIMESYGYQKDFKYIILMALQKGFEIWTH